MDYLIVGALVALSGMFSGLTLGLFSLNLSDLQRKIKLKNEQARRVYAVRKNGNLLLCTLLLGNVAVNSALAIFLGEIASGFVAGLISTGLIVVFGEIIPQAVFSRYALEVGARTDWLVRAIIVLFYPVAGPLAWALDKALGAELPTVWPKSEIKEIIRDHEDSPHSKIDADEERILLGALSFSEKEARHIMTPKTVVFAVAENMLITNQLLRLIRRKGFTRVPVYRKSTDDVVGVLYVKELIGIELDQGYTVADVYRKDPLIMIPESTKLDVLLDEFIRKRKHMAFLYDTDGFGILKGLVTLEDIIEEILNIEIMDEADAVPDLRDLAREAFRLRLMREKEQERERV